MNGKHILKGLGYVDEQFVYEAENTNSIKKKKLTKFMKIAIPVTAAFAVMVCSFALLENDANITYPQQSMRSADKIAIKGHFWYDLDPSQISKVLPIISQKYEVEGTVHYSSDQGKAELYQVSTSVIVDENLTGTINISPNEVKRDCIIVGKPVISEIHGIPVNAGLFITDKNSRGQQNYIYFAEFKLKNIAYYMEFTSKNREAEAAFTDLVSKVIQGGKADLSIFDNPVIPKIIEKDLSESEAYEEKDFGQYLFEIPSDYAFNSASRLLNQNSNLLFASWSKGYDDVTIHVSSLDEDCKARIVSPKDTSLFRMALYPIPWADSMPKDKAYIIENPVFKIEDLTVDIIRQREYTRGEADDSGRESISMRFSVLYDDVVVEVNAEGLSAEYLYDKLTSLPLET